MGMRSVKVQEELKKEISKILQEEIKDSRIGFVTITRVDLTGDLRHGRVYYSTLGDDEKRIASMEGIESAAAYIRKLIGERLKLRYVPELIFIYDKSIEYSIGLEKTFERLKDEHPKD